MLDVKALLTAQKAGFEKNEKQANTARRRDVSEDKKPGIAYRPNPLNYALTNTYKLFVLFKDGTARTFICPAVQSTYNQYLYQLKPYNMPIVVDFNKGWQDFENRIRFKYKGQYKQARIYEITGHDSREIVRYENGLQVAAPYPFDGVLIDKTEICPIKLAHHAKDKI